MNSKQTDFECYYQLQNFSSKDKSANTQLSKTDYKNSFSKSQIHKELEDLPLKNRKLAMSWFKSKVSNFINSPSSKFKEIFNPQERWQKHLAIVQKNPDIVTVIVEKAPSSKLKMSKLYLQFGMNKNTTINQLRQNIRKVLQISQIQSITLFCEGTLPMATQKISNLVRYQQPDGWIYFYISEHDSFGSQ